MLGYPDASLVKSILAKRCVHIHGRTLRYTKYESGTNCEPGRSKWLAQGNLGATPHKSNSSCRRVKLSVYPQVLYSFPLINALLISVLSVSVEIIFCKAKSQGPCHWLLVKWLESGTFNPAQHLAGNPSPAPSSCRPSHPRSYAVFLPGKSHGQRSLVGYSPQGQKESWVR